MAFEGTEQLLRRTQNFVDDHRDLYLSSGGAKGHIVDMSHAGSKRLTPTLLLRTIGRKSGRELIAPLIYGVGDGAWIVIASKGGAPEHPAWYLNLAARPETEFQVGTQAFRGTWRQAADDDRTRLWDYMVTVYPPYADYQVAAGDRLIPVLLLEPASEIPVFAAID